MIQGQQSKFYRLYENPFVYAIRQGLVAIIPIPLIGSFSLILKFLPIPSYQAFLTSFQDGFFINFFTGIYTVTLGILSLFAVISISAKYARLKTQDSNLLLGAICAAVCAFMIFAGIFSPEFDINSFGARGMFTAVFSAVIFGGLYVKLVEKNRFTLQFYTVGADADFNTAMSVCVPIGIVAVLAFALNLLIQSTFGVLGLEAMFHEVVLWIFRLVENKFARVVLYVALSSFFWFFGIHGTNVLFGVEELVFGVDTGILSKAFLDVYVLMGGSGTTICLLIAILVFSKRKNTKSLARFAAFPMAFNINELMVFGLPIIYNLWFFIPFMLVPLLCIGISFVAVQMGIAPQPNGEGISWVTPLVVNAYQATGSIAGCILQLVNIALGTVVYGFFLRRYERSAEVATKKDVLDIEAEMREYEKEGVTPALLDLPGNKGSVARMLASDLQHLMKGKESLDVYYQPIFDAEYRCIGAEALTRWNHPWCGVLYPPLLIAIAKEIHILTDVEKEIFHKVARDLKLMSVMAKMPDKISINLTPQTLSSDEFYEFMAELVQDYPNLRGTLYIELKEEVSVLISDEFKERIQRIQALGILFTIDDFSMGRDSIRYLQSEIFSAVKLDGAISSSITKNEHIGELVATTVKMTENLADFRVLAKRVETKEQKEALERAGCVYYQGDLYSPPQTVDAFIQLMKHSEAKRKRMQQ